jgi:hypothetical protein
MAISLNDMPIIEAKLVQELCDLTKQAFAEMRTPPPDAGLAPGARPHDSAPGADNAQAEGTGAIELSGARQPV